MQVTTEQLDPCKIALTVTVGADKVEVARKKAFQQAVSGLQLPGFRKGKVPAHIAKNYVDEGRVLQRAAELVIPESYTEAIAETKLEPFAQPDVELVDLPTDGTLVFKAYVPMRPVITLGLYKGLAVEHRKVTIGEGEVTKEIERMRERYAEFSEVEDRTAQTGDMLLVDLTAVVEGKDLPDLATPQATVIEIGKNIPDLDSGLVGLAKGDEKTIEAVYPTEFENEEMQGKRATFTVIVKEIRSKQLPELTDALAKKALPSVDTVDGLKAAILEGLEKQASDASNNELEFNLVSKIVETSQIHFPEVLLRAEIDAELRQLEASLKEQNIEPQAYLNAIGKSVDQLRGEVAVGATQRIKNSLVLSEVARAESISADDADVDAKIAQRAAEANVSPAAVRAFAEKQGSLDGFRDQALTEKILSFLKDSSKITLRTLTSEALEAEDKAKALEASAAPIAIDASAEAKPAASAKKATKKKVEETDVAETAPVAEVTEAAAPKRKTAKKTEA
jgi:trigger factor